MPNYEDYRKWDEIKQEVLEPLESLARNIQRPDWAETVRDIAERGYAEEFREFIQPHLDQLFQGLANFPGPFAPKRQWHTAKVTLPDRTKE